MLFDSITKTHVEQALQRIVEEGYPSNRKSSTYDLVYKGTAFPPKYVLSLAGFFADRRFIIHDEFSGGENSAGFDLLRGLGFNIVSKKEAEQYKQAKTGNTTFHYKYVHHKTREPINSSTFKSEFQAYINYCKRSDWLTTHEAYKFKFGRWLNERVDFTTQTNTEILNICRESQEQDFGTGTKGVNFIISSKRYADHFIIEEDIDVLRRMSDPSYLVEDSDVGGRAMSFPKLSVWAGSLFPGRYMVYANEELTKGIAHVFGLEKYSKSGVRSFNFANYCLREIQSLIQNDFSEEALSLLQMMFPAEEKLKPIDWAWLTQDFILFLIRRRLNFQPSYYWVNQGDQYKNELSAGCITAPVDQIHHHKRLKDLKEGDVIIHYANTEVKAISKVSKEYSVGPRAYSPDDKEWYNVEVNYEALEKPIALKTLQEKLKDSTEVLPKKYSPFDRNLGINQSYLLLFNEESFNTIFSEIEALVSEPQESYNMKSEAPLNQILYGPPGTGKTYNTINHALSIIENTSIENIQNENRLAVLKRFKAYEDGGQIVFTTFHQSMSYEDFVEGIKPVLNENENDSGELNTLEYEIKNGILKDLVQKISDDKKLLKSQEKNIFIPEKHFDLPINKVSLGNSQLTEDKAIYDFCIANNCIANGFGEDIDFTGVKNKKDIRQRFKDGGIEIKSMNDFAVSAMERLIFWMKKDQLVFVSNGNSTLRSIGVITGDYYFDDSTPIEFSQFRPVKWLHKEVDIPIKEIYPKKFSQQSIYQLYHEQVKKEIFKNNNSQKLNTSNYVLIIDEINRGNVSSIFGELITLLENDKRQGEAEELSATLPYSQTKFSVPNNLHILGTMNTADRSVEALDTALRRRFSFLEMMPDYSLLENKEIEGIKLDALLKTINERVEMLVDRDHQIGHSYFIGLKSKADLKDAFKDKVIPLLQEYFYGDYGKIGLVLGKGFVEKKASKDFNFADFSDFTDQGGLKQDSFQLVNLNEEKFDIINALEGLNKKQAQAE